jgi:hypothetical protein
LLDYDLGEAEAAAVAEVAQRVRAALGPALEEKYGAFMGHLVALQVRPWPVTGM